MLQHRSRLRTIIIIPRSPIETQITTSDLFVGPEAMAIGNLAVQALADDDVADIAQAREVIRNSFPVDEYQPRDTAAWDDAYGRFLKLLG